MTELEKQRTIYDSWNKSKDKTEALIEKLQYCLTNDEWTKRQKLDNIEGLLNDGGAFQCSACDNVHYLFHTKWSAIMCECGNEIRNNQI